MSVINSAARDEWRANWPLVLATCLTAGVATTHFYALGIFMKPVSAATGLSRAQIGSVQIIYSLATILIGPMVGILADKTGPRKLVLGGVIFYSLSIACYYFVSSNLLILYGIALFGALSGVFCNAPLLTMAITRRFSASLGLALAVTLAGTGLYAGLVMPVVATKAIAAVGFRSAYLIIGAIGLTASLPLLFLFFDRGASRPENSRASRKPGDPAARQGAPVKELLRGRYFWRIALSGFLVTMAATSMLAHFVPLMTDRGVDPATAAAVAGAIGISTILGRIGAGMLLDIAHPPLIGAICFIGPFLASMAILAGTASLGSAIGSALLIGLAVGAEVDIVSFLTRRYLGLGHYAALYSTLYGLTAMGAGIGVPLAGFIFDRSGNYNLALYLFMASSAVASILIYSLAPRGERQSGAVSGADESL